VVIRDKLNFGLKSMNLIALVPLFSMKPLRAWASSSFYPLMVFYEGPMGFVVEISVLIIILFSYVLLRRVQSYHEDSIIRSENYRLEKWVMKNFSGVIRYIIPQRQSKAYRNIEKKKKAAMDFLPIEWLYVQKCMFSLSSCLLIILVTTAVLVMGTSAVYSNPTTPNGFLAGELKGKALVEANRLTAFDNEILKRNSKTLSYDLISAEIQKKYQLNGEQLRITTNRIIVKLTLLSKYKFSWKIILLVYVMIILGWYIPDLMLLLRRKIAHTDLMSEVTKFQLVIMMMMRIDSMSVEYLLEWLERFSFVLKEPIQRAIMDYDAGAEEALLSLRNSTDNEDFKKIVTNLISAVNKLSINQAFDELESEKNYYLEKRKIQNERMIDSKIGYGQLIGFTPTYALVILYFMLPLIYASVSEMQTYFDKLSM
jgi:hypothetical protein